MRARLRRIGGWLRSWIPRVALGAAALVVLAGVLVAFLKMVPEWLAQDDLQGKDRAEDIGRARTASLAVLAGLLAVTGAVLSWLSYRLNRSGHITDRFTRAIDQLGNPSMDVRIGGIYALERIAKDSRHDHPQVIEVLTAYVREHSPWPPRGRDAEIAEQLERGRIETDVQAAMTVIGRRRRDHDVPGDELDLMGTDLRGLRLIEDGAHVGNSNLSNSNLQGAYLLEADLSYAGLIETNLKNANLTAANLRSSIAHRAALEGAYLRLANLDGARLYEATWNTSTRWPDGVDPEVVTAPESPVAD